MFGGEIHSAIWNRDAYQAANEIKRQMRFGKSTVRKAKSQAS